MRRNDAQVSGVLTAIKLPIRQAKWWIEAASDKPADKEIAERIMKNLFEEMTTTWDDYLRQALTYTDFGFSLFEKVFMLYPDNKVLLRKLAPRLQTTLYRWYTDDDDNFLGIQQFVQMRDSGAFEYIDIWREKLVLFVNEQEGNNFEGRSVLRPAYKHWYIKDKLYKIDAIGHDRWASGIPVLKEPVDGANNEDTGRAATILENLHSRERSYLHLPGGWDAEMFEKSGGNDAIIKSIQHHNEEIAKNVLAQFINLGTSSSGSRALGESFEELFMQSLNAIADYIAERTNRWVIKQMVRMNWGDKVELPRLKHNKIMLNQKKWLEGVSSVGLSNAITRDNKIEQVMRESLALPLMSEETMAERDEMRKQQIESMKNAGNDDDKPTPPSSPKKPGNSSEKPNSSKKKDETEKDDVEEGGKAVDPCNHKHLNERMREASELEAMICDFDEVEKCLDDGVDKFTKQVMKIKKQQAEFLAKEVFTTPADDIVVPFVDKLADRLYKESKRQMNKGRRHLREEITRQKKINKDLEEPELLDGDDYQDRDKVDQFLRDKSKSDATQISNNTLGLALFGLYNIDPDVTSQGDKEESVFDTVMTTGNTTIAGIANSSINKAYGLGREVQAASTSGIEFAIYSSVLDGGTCVRCAPKDGVAHKLEDPRFQTPNPNCEGGDRCRCINIYVTKDTPIEGELRSPADWEKENKMVDKGELKAKDMVKRRREGK
jgi:hypothetical protein